MSKKTKVYTGPSQEKLVNYLEKRIQEIDRWLRSDKFKDVEPHELDDYYDQRDLISLQAERRAVQQTLKYVNSVKFRGGSR